MAVRVLLMLAAFSVLYGCGQASSPVERQEEQGGVEQAAEGEGGQPKSPSSTEATEQAVGNMPIAGVVGETVEGGSYDFRVLEYFVTDRYHYLTDPTFDSMQEDYVSQMGKLVVMSYSVTNTSPQTISPNPVGQLHARAGNRVEVYEEAEDVAPPHHNVAGLPIDDLPPRQMVVSQFIFDVPGDVEPELVAVSDQPTIASVLDVGVVDLREEDPQGPRPEEIFALQMEYYNMGAYERGYELFAEESKARVPEQLFSDTNQQDERQDPVAFTDYSFPTVKIEGDRAAIQVVRSYSYEREEGQERVTQEAVLEDEGWRILMRDEQYEYYLGE